MIALSATVTEHQGEPVGYRRVGVKVEGKRQQEPLAGR